MKKENYRDAVSRFTKAYNFPGGVYILATYNPADGGIAELSAFGDNDVTNVFALCLGTLDVILKGLDDEGALKLREGMRKVIIADEERRFQGREAKL